MTSLDKDGCSREAPSRQRSKIPAQVTEPDLLAAVEGSDLEALAQEGRGQGGHVVTGQQLHALEGKAHRRGLLRLGYSLQDAQDWIPPRAQLLPCFVQQHPPHRLRRKALKYVHLFLLEVILVHTQD